MITAGIVFYVIMAIGAGLSQIDKWNTAEAIVCGFIGAFWPIMLVIAFFKKVTR